MKDSIKADPWLLTHNCDHLLILGLYIFFLIPAKSLLTPKTDADAFQAKPKETLTLFHNFLS